MRIYPSIYSVSFCEHFLISADTKIFVPLEDLLKFFQEDSLYMHFVKSSVLTPINPMLKVIVPDFFLLTSAEIRCSQKDLEYINGI